MVLLEPVVLEYITKVQNETRKIVQYTEIAL